MAKQRCGSWNVGEVDRYRGPHEERTGRSRFWRAHCADNPLRGVGWAIEVQPTRSTVVGAGNPTAAVAVTQCNQLVAVYMVMPDGRLLRFDKTSGVSNCPSPVAFSDDLVLLPSRDVRNCGCEITCSIG
jgi:hypothetical protein